MNAKGNMNIFFQLANELPGVKGEIVEKGRVYYLTFWNAPAVYARKVMSLRLYSVNVPVRVSFILCKAFGKN